MGVTEQVREQYRRYYGPKRAERELALLERHDPEGEGPALSSTMESVVERLQARNAWECVPLPDGERFGEGTRWAMVNRHLYRIRALYLGADVFLAGFAGARPHQRLWEARG